MEIQIVSGFMGAGKTTFLNQYMPTLEGKTVVIQNELGEVKLDAKVADKDIPSCEITAGCICCELAMAFQDGIVEIAKKYHPDRILIEPSGIGRLNDVVKACLRARDKSNIELKVTKLITIVDLSCFEEDLEALGLMYQEQIQRARLLLVSHTEGLSKVEKKRLLGKLREENPWAVIYEGDFRQLGRTGLLALISMIKDYEEEPEGVTSDYIMAEGTKRKFKFS